MQRVHTDVSDRERILTEIAQRREFLSDKVFVSVAVHARMNMPVKTLARSFLDVWEGQVKVLRSEGKQIIGGEG